MSVSRVLSEEVRSVVLGLHADEPVIAAQSPAARVPLEAGAYVTGQEGLALIDAEAGLLEEAQGADATRDVRHHRAPIRNGEHEVAAVVQQVWGLDVRGDTSDVEALRHPDRPGDFAFDTHVAVEVERQRRAQVV